MPIETIPRIACKRYRWTFNRIIKGERIRQTKLLPLEVSSAEADGLARRWEADANGARRAVVTIGDCVRQHVADKRDLWKEMVFVANSPSLLFTVHDTV
jgi:hypothetical protein